MSVRVLVVDDSSFYRKQIVDAIQSDPFLELAGTANNGREAVQRAMELKPDVITMDVEMPILDGISAVKEIMAKAPTSIIMFSSLTHDGARATLDALDAGAVDFYPKQAGGQGEFADHSFRMLRSKMRALGLRGLRRVPVATPAALRSSESSAEPAFPPLRPGPPAAPARAARNCFAPNRQRVLIIGASTGGPAAVQVVLKGLPGGFRLPVLVVQHMPASFTKAFAARLDGMLPLRVKEVVDGERPEPGTIYLAAGGCHTVFDRQGSQPVLHLQPAKTDEYYRPSVDLAFESAARVYGGEVMAIVLTGMGADGAEGARALKQQQACVWAQDQASCVIYGMPAAVARAGLADEVLSPEEIARRFGG